MATVETTALPLLRNDILWLSLGFIKKPASSKMCQVCERGLKAHFRKEEAAWRIRGCSHYIFVTCLKNISTQTDGTADENCRTCKSLGCQLNTMAGEQRARRVKRLEVLLFPS
jgi:hypothetical protein